MYLCKQKIVYRMNVRMIDAKHKVLVGGSRAIPLVRLVSAQFTPPLYVIVYKSATHVVLHFSLLPSGEGIVLYLLALGTMKSIEPVHWIGISVFGFIKEYSRSEESMKNVSLNRRSFTLHSMSRYGISLQSDAA